MTALIHAVKLPYRLKFIAVLVSGLLFGCSQNDHRTEIAGNEQPIRTVAFTIDPEVKVTELGSNSPPVLKNYGIEDGLPTHWVRCAVQDQSGFIWFATAGGLTRFDGYTFKLYPANFNDTIDIGADRVLDLVIDSDGELWVSRLFRPLQRFDPKSEKSFTYSLEHQPPSNENVYDLYFDPPSSIWVGHSKGGLISKIDKQTGKISNYPLLHDNLQMASKVWDINRDSNGDLWAATNQALYVFDSTSLSFKSIQLQGPGDYPKHFDNIQEFKSGKLIVESTLGPTLIDKETSSYQQLIQLPKVYRSGVNGYFIRDENSLWIANPSGDSNRNNGIIRYHLPSDKLVYYNMLPDIPLLKDRSGNIWVHNGESGVSSFKPGQRKFSQYTYSFTETVSCLVQDLNGFFWAGTDKGLYKAELTEQNHLVLASDFTSDLGLKSISSLLVAKDGSIWIASTSELFRYSAEGSFRRYLIPNGATMDIEIRGMIEDDSGAIWLSGSHLIKINPEGGPNEIYNSPRGKLTEICQDSYGNLWLVDEDKIWVFNQINQDFHSFQVPFSHKVTSMFMDHHEVWIGTNTGLYKMKQLDFDTLVSSDLKIECFNHLMPVNYALSIMGDQNNLWVLYPRGLAKIDLSNQQVDIFDQEDGLSDEILTNKFVNSFIGIDNNLYLSWNNGMDILKKQNIRYNKYIPPVVFTDFKVFNKSVKIQDTIRNHQILTSTINSTRSITLPPGLSFTLEFASLDYTNPEINQYSYKLEGFDEQWSPHSFDRTATYTNLWEGNYTFTVRGSNNDGEWNYQGSTIDILVLPPWYRTNLAYIFYLIMAVVLVGSGYLLVIKTERVKIKHEIARLELEKANQLDHAKTQFFANISHEFRTPLTLILGPLKQMREGTLSENSQKIIQLMMRNGERLLGLIDQLLDFTRISSGGVRLKASPGDLVKDVHEVFIAFDFLARKQMVDYVFDSDPDKLTMYFDADQLRKIIINLLSNAFKFTENGDSIHLRITTQYHKSQVDKGEGTVQIVIKDSGSGIAPDKLNYIFNRYYQADDPYFKNQTGKGIGLALVKQLVELHYGEIRVSSEIGSGTKFTINLPLGKAHLEQEEIFDQELQKPFDEAVLTSLLQEFHESPIVSDESDQPMVLIVEDNKDMRLYLKESLSDSYKILLASNGQVGLEMAQKFTPDLIICDVLMPVMDGFQFIDRIREMEATAHIPFIFLTARADNDSRLKGLELGSDNYMIKPFDIEELKLNVNNHLNRVQQLRSFFVKQLSIHGEIDEVESLDSRFLKKAIELIEEELDNHEFTVNQFSNQMGMSHTQLYRKLITLTGHPPSAFIRSIRLKKAAQLIVQEYGNTSEVAYAVGFNSLSYFAKCFKEQFGVPPSAYNKQKMDQVSNKE